MGWEKRRNGWYYYRKRKVGRRVVSEYVGAGSGLVGPCRIPIAEETLAIRAATRAARADGRRAFESEEAEDRSCYDRFEAIVRTALESAGYHRPNRGPWRRRRMSMSHQNGTGPPAAPAIPVDLAAVAEQALLARFIPDNRPGRAGIALRAELAGPAPSPLERLLVERVVLCWLQVHAFEGICAQSGAKTLDALRRMERRRDQAHRRYLQAIKVLAQVRRLERPAIQVSVTAP